MHDAALESVGKHLRTKLNVGLSFLSNCIKLTFQQLVIPILEPLISKDPPTLTEVQEAISKLKGDKVEGICSIPAWKANFCRWTYNPGLHALLAAIWQSGTIPQDLLRGVVIAFWKGKGDQWDCSNYSGITAQHTRKSSCSYSVEHCHKFSCGLLTDYTDLKKCDLVHSKLLWWILRLQGILTRIVGLMASLYTGTKSAVVCGSGISSFWLCGDITVQS